MTRYTIRYRCTDRAGMTALIVEDEQGGAHVFSGGRLRDRLVGDGASARLARRLAIHGTWVPVPRVSPYTIEGLRHLTAPPTPRDRSRSGARQVAGAL